jgi:hypothetical protein
VGTLRFAHPKNSPRHCERSNPWGRKLDCFVADAPRNDGDKKRKQPPAILPTATSYSIIKPDDYFDGYLNSGAAFSASLVVFIEASHLSFLVS